MNAKQLKNSILQMAVQGKLVPQDEEDEPASILIERIRQEKEVLIKEKKIKRDKKESIIYKGEDGKYYEEVGGEIACIDGELPFDIPDSWRWCRLGSVVNFINGDRGKNYPSKDKLFEYGDIPFISAINIENLTIRTDNLLYVSNEQYNKLGSGKLILNDIVVCIRGSLGKSCIYPLTIGAIASSLVILRNFTELNNLFLIKYINSNLFYSEIKKYDNGTAQPNLSATDLKKFLVPLPPLAEQQRIVDKIEEVLPLINSYDKSYEKLQILNSKFPEQFKKSILQWAVQGKLVPQDEEDEPASILIERIKLEREHLIKEKKIKKDKKESNIFKGEDGKYYEEVGGEIACIEEELPFDIPDSWSWVTLNNISDMYTGNSINEQLKATKYTNLKDGFNYIATKDINFNNIITYDNGVKIPFEEIKFKNTSEKSILLCLEGGSAGKKIALTNKKVCFGNKLCSINSLGVNISYVYYFLQSPIFLKNFENIKSGMIGGVGINKLKNIVIPIPPLAQQQRIVDKIEALITEIDKF